MKKFLSIILACAMIMSLFCVVPASAAVASGVYWVDDFEEAGASRLLYNTGTAQAGGYNGSAFSKLKSKTVVAGTTKIAYNTMVDMELVPTLLSTIKPGETVKVSFKYKLTYPLADNSKLSIMGAYKTSSTAATTYPAYNYTIPNPKDTTNWQTFGGELVVPETAWTREGTGSKDGYTLTLLYLRWGDSNMSGVSFDATTEESTVVGFYMDDLVIARTNYQGDTIHDGSVTGGLQSVYTTGGVVATTDPTDPTNAVFSTKAQANGDYYNLLQFNMYAQASKANVAIQAGDEVNFSAKVMVSGSPYTGTGSSQFQARAYDIYTASTAKYTSIWTDLTAEGKAQWIQDTAGDNLKFSLAKNNEWQTVSWTFTVPENNTGSFGGVRLYLTDNKNTIPSDEDGKKVDMGHATFYFDDVTISIASKTPVVTGLTAEVDEDGIVTPAYTFTKGASDATDGTDASVYRLYNAQGGVVGSGLANAITIPEGVTATTLEIIPVTSTGYIGKAVTCAITEAEEEVEPIVGTYFTNLAGNLTLSSGTAIENAKIIFVTYDANGKMVDFDVVSDVDVAVNGTINVAPTKVLNAGTKSVVMLWQDMIKCVPLADALAY